MIIPRDYQIESVAAVEKYFIETTKGNPCICIPTGGGKSPVAAMLIKRFSGEYGLRVVVVTHVKELVMQNYDKAVDFWPEGRKEFGVYSAGLRCRDTDEKVIFGGIQSLYDKAEELGKVNLLIIDEAHRIPLTGTGQYRTLIADLLKINPKMRVVGLTATPYRLDSGAVCGWTEHHIMNEIIYDVPVKELIARGYLTKPVSQPATKADVSAVPVAYKGDYLQEALEAAVSDLALVKIQVNDLVRLGENRIRWAVFCVGIKHAEAVTMQLRGRGVATALLHSKIGSQERDEIVAGYHAGKYRALVNVNIASEGFDNDQIDLIALMRPTMSAGLYYQQCGRGLRVEKVKCQCGKVSVEMEPVCSGCGSAITRVKQDVRVLDFAGNIGEHGAIDKISAGTSYIDEGEEKRTYRMCPECDQENHIRFKVCQYCGYEFPKRDRENTANPLANLDHPVISQPHEHDVERTSYSALGEKLVVHYWCGGIKFTETFDKKDMFQLQNS
ncbi:DEAD/DEAH box helicase [bacterium]|nr:DEAD/DEAH box helicase [bacterium]